MKKYLVLIFLLVGFGGAALTVRAKSSKNDAMVVQQAKIQAQKAIEIAIGAKKGLVSKMVLEAEKGKVIWDVEVVLNDSSVYDLEIDANTGKILESKLDKKDEDDESKDDDD